MSPGIWHQDDITPDGKRFLINTLVQDQSTPIDLADHRRRELGGRIEVIITTHATGHARSRTLRHHADRRTSRSERLRALQEFFQHDEPSQKEMLSLLDLYDALGCCLPTAPHPAARRR